MKVCEKCGTHFECGAASQASRCWCQDMPPLVPIPPQFQDCLCPSCLRSFAQISGVSLQANLVEKTDFYYDEQGLMVFTREYHLKRGYCCENNCRHCPYPLKSK